MDEKIISMEEFKGKGDLIDRMKTLIGHFAALKKIEFDAYINAGFSEYQALTLCQGTGKTFKNHT